MSDNIIFELRNWSNWKIPKDKLEQFKETFEAVLESDTNGAQGDLLGKLPFVPIKFGPLELIVLTAVNRKNHSMLSFMGEMIKYIQDYNTVRFIFVSREDMSRAFQIIFGIKVKPEDVNDYGLTYK